MEAIEDTHTEEYLTERLEHLRDDFRDEIPSEVVHSSSSDNKYKARRGWFNLLAGHLSLGLEDGHIKDPELRKKVEQFIEWSTRGEFKHGGDARLTTKDDIDKANNVINAVLGTLAPPSVK